MNHFIKPWLSCLWLITLLAGLACQSSAEIVFKDEFASGASTLWGNEVGAWSAVDGVYSASAPNNAPNAFSSLPFSLTDFSMDLDINGVSDGGVWLRSTPVPGTAIGIQGVLLVLKYAESPNGQIYWHIITDPNFYGDGLNANIGAFMAGSNPHVHIEVAGNTYSAFLNGSTNAATTITTADFASGRVALYSFSSQTFDNVRIEVPGIALSTVTSVAAPFVQVRWQSVFGTWYQVQTASASAPGKWINVGKPVPGTGATMSTSVEATRDQKFYRVEALQ